MKIETVHRGTTRARHRREAIDIDAVSSEGRDTVPGIGPGGYATTHRSGVESGQTGVVFR